jgi:hypothetical protein
VAFCSVFSVQAVHLQPEIWLFCSANIISETLQIKQSSGGKTCEKAADLPHTGCTVLTCFLMQMNYYTKKFYNLVTV